MARNERKTSKLAWMGLVVCLGIVAWMAWSLLVPHEFHTTGPMNRSEVRWRTPIELPASARNIQIATYSHWLQLSNNVRFEAPVADCEEHAKHLLPDAEAKAIDPNNMMRHFYFPPGSTRTLDWFDIPDHANVVCFGEGGPGQAIIYVDRDHGIFYYHITD